MGGEEGGDLLCSTRFGKAITYQNRLCPDNTIIIIMHYLSVPTTPATKGQGNESQIHPITTAVTQLTTPEVECAVHTHGVRTHATGNDV